MGPSLTSTTESMVESVTMVESTATPTLVSTMESTASVRPRPSPTPSARFMPAFPSTTPTPPDTLTMLASPATFPMAMEAMDSPTMDNLTSDFCWKPLTPVEGFLLDCYTLPNYLW